MFDEEIYWERQREAYENRCPEYGDDWLFLEEEAPEIEAVYGRRMSALDEDDLMEIVKRRCGVEPVSAQWNENLYGIFYVYEEFAL